MGKRESLNPAELAKLRERDRLRAARRTPEQVARKLEKDRAWRVLHPEKVKEYQRKARGRRDHDKNEAYQREYRSRLKQETRQKYSKKYYARHREEILARGLSWRTDNAEKMRAYRGARLAVDPEKVRAQARANAQKRYASCKTRTDKAPTAAQLAAVLKDPCLYCGGPAEHVDHFIPLARGGTHTLDNLVAACAACNTSKGAKLPDVEWTGRKRSG